MSKIKKRVMLHAVSKNSGIGEDVACPFCGVFFVKKVYQQTFCSGRCKDKYWNLFKTSNNHKKRAISRKDVSGDDSDELDGELTRGDEDICTDFDNQYN
jgi:hypothetical protein